MIWSDNSPFVLNPIRYKALTVVAMQHRTLGPSKGKR
jgi:hypothetical protein